MGGSKRKKQKDQPRRERARGSDTRGEWKNERPLIRRDPQ